MASPSARRWLIAALLLSATAINYMDRAALAGASIRVTGELRLDDIAYGNLEFAFGWAFAAGSVVFGLIADRFSVYRLYPSVLCAWSLVGMATGLARDYPQLLLCRSLLGFFEAGQWPCALKATYLLLDERERTMGNSLLQSGASVGAILTPQLLKIVMAAGHSWRFAFVAIGAIGLAWVGVWLAVTRSQRAEMSRRDCPSASDRPLTSLLKTGQFWALAILVLGIQAVWQAYRVWLMLFLVRGRGFAENAALNFSSAYFVASDIGCIAAGAISIVLIRRGHSPHAARRRIFACACGLTSLSALLPWLGHGRLLLAVLLLIGGGALALFPCFYSFVQELSGRHVGRVIGILSTWAWIVTSPLQSGFGWLARHAHSYDPGLVIAGMLPWLGVAALAALWRTALPRSP